MTKDSRGAELEPRDAIEWDHEVQFYESDEFLSSSIADFVSDGLLIGDPLVVLATPHHRDGVIAHLGPEGVGWDEARESGRLQWLDAREVLDMIMVGSAPDRDRFDRHIGRLIRSSREARGHGRVRAYGELVDLLWREGRVDAALELEDMWNDLGRDGSLSLLCAYSRGNMYRESSGAHQQICCRHARVLPDEGPTPRDEQEH